MREFEEILRDIKEGEWYNDREKTLRLVQEYCEARNVWMEETHPGESELMRLKTLTHLLFKHVVIYETFPEREHIRPISKERQLH